MSAASYPNVSAAVRWLVYVGGFDLIAAGGAGCTVMTAQKQCGTGEAAGSRPTGVIGFDVATEKTMSDPGMLTARPEWKHKK